MYSAISRASRGTSIGSAGMLVQDKFHGLSLGRWVYLDIGILVVAIGIVLLTWEPFATRILWWRKPKLEQRGVGQFFRRGRGSREDHDLHVVYARIRNVRNGGGDRATLFNAEAWMTVEDENGRPIGHGCQGNWVSVQAGTPDPKTFKQATFRPNGEQHGLEIVAKFVWDKDAYLAGEVHPNLPPGKYRVRAQISDAVHKATIFEWDVVNPGADGYLRTPGLGPTPDFPQLSRRLSEIATAASASASQADSVSWGSTAPLPDEGSSQALRKLDSPRMVAAQLIAECTALISAAWEGHTELPQKQGTGDVTSANALFRKARPTLAKYYADEMYRVNYDLQDGASAAAVVEALSNALPALHNFQNRYPA